VTIENGKVKNLTLLQLKSDKAFRVVMDKDTHVKALFSEKSANAVIGPTQENEAPLSFERNVDDETKVDVQKLPPVTRRSLELK
jgi:hypothetical protein